MKVKVYDISHNGDETFRAECDHSECFPNDQGYNDDESEIALDQLRTSGRYWAGGGAAPLVLLMRAE